MAKKKKGKTTRRRRRSVGALSMSASSPLMKYGPIVLGYFMADKIQAPIDKMVGDKLDGKIVGAAEAGLGALLVFGKGKKSMPKTVVGGLLLGVGAKKLLHEMGIGAIGGAYGRVPVIGGAYGRVPVIGGRRRVGSYNPNNQLGAYNPHNSLNGSIRRVMSGVSTPGTVSGSGSGIRNSGGGDMMN